MKNAVNRRGQNDMLINVTITNRMEKTRSNQLILELSETLLMFENGISVLLGLLGKAPKIKFCTVILSLSLKIATVLFFLR
ncbi:hypothetical protein D3C76_1477430 [compost metagenome]